MMTPFGLQVKYNTLVFSKVNVASYIIVFIFNSASHRFFIIATFESIPDSLFIVYQKIVTIRYILPPEISFDSCMPAMPTGKIKNDFISKSVGN